MTITVFQYLIHILYCYMFVTLVLLVKETVAWDFSVKLTSSNEPIWPQEQIPKLFLLLF
jgi:hypothetical protein